MIINEEWQNVIVDVIRFENGSSIMLLCRELKGLLTHEELSEVINNLTQPHQMPLMYKVFHRHEL